jgi:hypothetical protein
MTAGLAPAAGRRRLVGALAAAPSASRTIAVTGPTRTITNTTTITAPSTAVNSGHHYCGRRAAAATSASDLNTCGRAHARQQLQRALLCGGRSPASDAANPVTAYANCSRPALSGSETAPPPSPTSNEPGNSSPHTRSLQRHHQRPTLFATQTAPLPDTSSPHRGRGHGASDNHGSNQQD